MSSEKTKQAWEPSDAVVYKAIDAYEHAPGVLQFQAMKHGLIAAVAADPLLSAAKDMRDALDALEQAFIAHTQWNGALPVEVIAARAALAKSRGEC